MSVTYSVKTNIILKFLSHLVITILIVKAVIYFVKILDVCMQRMTFITLGIFSGVAESKMTRFIINLNDSYIS